MPYHLNSQNFKYGMGMVFNLNNFTEQFMVSITWITTVHLKEKSELQHKYRNNWFTT